MYQPHTAGTLHGMTRCPYCFGEIHDHATRCVHCAGELRVCRRCGKPVGVVAHQKFVGLMRGGMKTQYRCQDCGLVLDGPRF